MGKKETVHHIDENKSNNSPENLMVLRTNADHQRLHSKLEVEVFCTTDGSCVVVKKQRECSQCNRFFEPDNNRDVFCSLICYASNKAKNIPTAGELKALVWTKPTSQLAKDLSVSDVAIGKWCAKLGVSKPPRGYWMKNKLEQSS